MKIVRVEWVDSSFRSGWAFDDEVNQVEPLSQGDAVGFLKGENEDAITLVMSSGSNKSTLGGLTIAKSAIKSIKEMRIK